jgi:hypothetical protein
MEQFFPGNWQWVSVALAAIAFLICTAVSIHVLRETDAVLAGLTFSLGFMAALIAYYFGIVILIGAIVWLIMYIIFEYRDTIASQYTSKFKLRQRVHTHDGHLGTVIVCPESDKDEVYFVDLDDHGGRWYSEKQLRHTNK